MTFLGAVIAFLLALTAIAFTAILLVSGWNALREEIMPNFRVAPPRPRTLGLALLGVVLPVVLTAAFTAYLAIWLIGMFIALGS